jgi:hypothetical protein
MSGRCNPAHSDLTAAELGKRTTPRSVRVSSRLTGLSVSSMLGVVRGTTATQEDTMATRTYFTPDPDRWTYRTERSAKQPGMRFSEVKSATGRSRRTARVAKPGTVFTSDPQSFRPEYAAGRATQ